MPFNTISENHNDTNADPFRNSAGETLSPACFGYHSSNPRLISCEWIGTSRVETFEISNKNGAWEEKLSGIG